MFLLLLGALTGCAMTSERFAEASVRHTCEWGFECAGDTFAVFESVDACVAAQEAWSAPYFACYDEHCATFDAAAARECLGALDPTACDALAPAVCGEVWTDCDAEALAECQYLAGAG